MGSTANMTLKVKIRVYELTKKGHMQNANGL